MQRYQSETAPIEESEFRQNTADYGDSLRFISEGMSRQVEACSLRAQLELQDQSLRNAGLGLAASWRSWSSFAIRWSAVPDDLFNATGHKSFDR